MAAMLQKKAKFKEKRKFFRHPVSLPLEFKKLKSTERLRAQTVDLSLGGLLFLSKRKLFPGMNIFVSLPFKDKVFRVNGRVARCDKDPDSRLYNVGIAFTKITDAFKVKLVEQLHLIEEYRCLRSIQLNREITLKKASEEWIELYSEQFRKLYW